MPTRGIVAVIAVVLAGIIAGPVSGASISNVYFSSGSVPSGGTFRAEGELPGPTKTFERGKDSVARMFVILRDMSAHTFGGELKGPGGKVVRKLNWSVQSFSIDLTVDDAPAGTYGFTLK